MATGVIPGEIWKTKLEGDASGTTFHLRILDGITRLQILDIPEPSLMAVQFLRLGLAGWDDYTDRNGLLIPFEEEKIDAYGEKGRPAAKLSCIKRLQPKQINLLAVKIMEGQVLSSDEAKN